jgi:two-component sensor histidine kinase
VDRIPALRRVILADVPLWKGALWSAAAVAVPTLVRLAVDWGAAGMPFVTYYPAVLLAALFLGWRWGAVVALASGAVANQMFIAEPLRFYADLQQALLVVLFALSCVALIWTGEMVRRLVRELQAAREREETLNHELMHRVKNMLATVSAMATLTARHTAPERFVEALRGRMRALEKATDLLGADMAGQCDLKRLIDGAVAPFRAGDNFTVEGPACELPRDACVPLSLALHELCTNAAKHGALTAEKGRVDVRWTLGEGDEQLLRLVWREEGGPPVPEVRKAGMGTQLLRRQRGLDGIEVRFERDGVRCEVRIGGCLAKQTPVDRAA